MSDPHLESATDSQTPSCYLIRRTFDDVEQMIVEARQWNLDFRQIECGEFHGDLLQFGSAGVHISDARFGRSLIQKGSPPAGMRTIAVPANPSIRLQWRNRRVDGQSLMVFPRGSELESVSGPDFHVYTCSLPESLFSEVGNKLGVGELDRLCARGNAVRVAASAINRLRDFLLRVCTAARDNPRGLSSDLFRSQLTSVLPSQILAALAQARGVCPPAAKARRAAAISTAEAYIERHACDDPRVREIAQAVGVSERTLEYAFIERFGIGPKEFITGYRFSAVRRALRAADRRMTRVSELANAWGFWHMGQFAAEYRRRFGELPSETLRVHIAS